MEIFKFVNFYIISKENLIFNSAWRSTTQPNLMLLTLVQPTQTYPNY